jgi:Zn-dependent protease
LPNIDLVAQVVVVFLALLFSLTVHEAAHAWSSSRLGDDTARTLGRVSLNPLVHIDPIGTVLFPLIALFTSVPVLGWAKPVPVNIRNLHGNWRRKYMAIAAAGPASNLVLALAAAALLAALPVSGGDPGGTALTVGAPVRAMLRAGVILNVSLAIFNMLPIPPLDGGNVASGLLTGSAARAFDSLRPYGFFILYALMFSGLLYRILTPLTDILLSILL